MRLMLVSLALLLGACAPCVAATADNAAERFDAVRQSPPQLRAFLYQMPKGGDLHNHLSGAVPAESTVRWAAADGLCVDTMTMSLIPAPCAIGGTRVSATRVEADAALRRRAVDAWSMQEWKPGAESGADHFFATFLKVSPLEYRRLGDMIAAVVSHAAAHHVSYVELMVDPDSSRIARLGARIGWNPDLGVMRRRLDSAGLGDTIRKATKHLDSADAHARAVMLCGTATAGPGCGVTVRYIYYAIRSRSPDMVFAQILAGFEWPAIDSRYVALNIVAPEHDSVAVRDFALHMSMFDFLHSAFPNTGITLHAGELSDKVATPATMRSHIRQSVEVGHARRIGHGVDVMQEDNADGLLRELHDRDVLVEVALTSNDVILGVTGGRHPLAQYLSHGVPVALATDDEGVSRSDMTHEYLRAVVDQHIGYLALKEMARNSITHSFADTATKQRLLTRLDADFAQFEARQ